jgi:hypothetical protein
MIFLDVGVAYLTTEPIDGLSPSPLYRERYCLFVPTPISWPAAPR